MNKKWEECVVLFLPTTYLLNLHTIYVEYLHAEPDSTWVAYNTDHVNLQH